MPEPPQKVAPVIGCRPTALQAIVHTSLFAEDAAITMSRSSP